ncbi:pilus assembly protein, partial [Colwellia psychrerythraea]
ETFASKTTIDIVRLASGESISFSEEVLAYVSKGTADFSDENNRFSAEDGDLIRSFKTDILATSDVEIVVVGQR